jgi:hypothetical protein
MTACWRFSNDFSASKTGLPSGVQRASELAMISRLKKRNRVAISEEFLEYLLRWRETDLMEIGDSEGFSS